MVTNNTSGSPKCFLLESVNSTRTSKGVSNLGASSGTRNLQNEIYGLIFGIFVYQTWCKILSISFVTDMKRIPKHDCSVISFTLTLREFSKNNYLVRIGIDLKLGPYLGR